MKSPVATIVLALVSLAGLDVNGHVCATGTGQKELRGGDPDCAGVS
jgi:hypothetical protein